MKFIKSKEKNGIYWYFNGGFIRKVFNDYVPDGERGSWEYWIFRWKRKGEVGNKIIDNVKTLKEAKELANKLKP